MSADSANQPSSDVALRSTRQRRSVMAAVGTLESFASSRFIHELVHERGESVGLSTVYRTLQALAVLGALDSMRAQNGELVYRACSGRHHHHLVCRNCGWTVEILMPGLEREARDAAERHGYRDLRSVLDAFGVCPACAGPGHRQSAAEAAQDR